MNNNKLAADPLALVLGILSLVLGIAGCCCYGLTAIIPLVLAIVGLISANRSLREYRENPEAFSPQSASNVNTARILNIIGIVINGFVVLISVVIIAFYGTMLSSEIFDEIRNNSNTSSYYDYEFVIDSSETSEEEYYLEEEDSVNIDVLIEDETVELEQEFN
ncbi:CCC motif membrane protein [Winogradskyella sp. A2]|uniref:CCC motif membrane protein n=1 Tax=Winogradskyella sp. A2 TaxID=3366944 RepID=UPI00398C7686